MSMNEQDHPEYIGPDDDVDYEFWALMFDEFPKMADASIVFETEGVPTRLSDVAKWLEACGGHLC